jgi:hypothetical protein
MNVAVGGDWPGPPDSNWNSDREMLVDYVRVYQCARGSVEGKGKACGTIDPAVEVHEDNGAPGLKDYVVYDDGFETLEFQIFVRGESKVVENTLVPGSFAFPGVTVDSEPRSNGAWEIEFAHTGLQLGDGFLGSVFLGSADMSDVEGVETGFNLDGGSSWTTNGELEFDIKIKSIDPETRLLVKMDSGYPSVGFVEIEVPATGHWHHVAVKMADLLANRNPGEVPLDVRNIQNVFVLESTGPAHVWVDNIRLQCAFNTEPEWWQIDKNCELRPRIAVPFFSGDFPAGNDERECRSAEGGPADIVMGVGEARNISPSCESREMSASDSALRTNRFSPSIKKMSPSRTDSTKRSGRAR